MPDGVKDRWFEQTHVRGRGGNERRAFAEKKLKIINAGGGGFKDMLSSVRNGFQKLVCADQGGEGRKNDAINALKKITAINKPRRISLPEATSLRILLLHELVIRLKTALHTSRKRTNHFGHELHDF